MKITVFNGSPRAEKGNTHIMVKEILKGAEAAGAETENIFLAGLQIEECLGCFTCWTKTPGTCIIKDDANALITTLIESDVIIFATPLYVDNVTGLMKTFMDRCIPLLDPHFETDPGGETVHRMRHDHYPRFVVVSNSGYPEQSHFQVLSLLFRRIARNMHTEVIAEIYRGAGELLGAKNVLLAPFLTKYRKLLRRAGEEIVSEGRLSEELKKKLEKPMIPHDRYTGFANTYWDKEIRKHGSSS